MASLNIEGETISDHDKIIEHVIDHLNDFFNSYTILLDNGMMEDYLPKHVTNQENTHLNLISSHEEINNSIWSLNKYGTPRPNGFVAYFFQT